jgi:hypothetical protein
MKTLSYSALSLFILAVALSSGMSQTKPKFEQPILVTSAGQSADVTLAGMLCKKLKLDAKTVPMAQPSDVDGNKTLIIVAGFSSKGLGAAGISRDQEMKRVQEVISAAKKKNIKIVMLHIGGKPRRGNQSDDFNKLAAESSNYMLVVKQGNEDQFFTQIASKEKISMDVVEKIAEAAGPLGEAFKP